MKTCGIFTIGEYTINVDGGKSVYLIPLGDIHRDAPLFYDVEWYRTLGWMEKIANDKSKTLIILGMGDYNDWVSSSERQMVRTVDMHETTITSMDRTAHQGVKLLYEEIKQFKKHFVGALGGNHYWTYSDGSTSDNELIKLLGTRFLGVKTLLGLKFCDRGHRTGHVEICAQHGSNAGRTTAGSMADVVRMAEGAEADIFLAAHDHRRFIFPGQTKMKREGHSYLKDRTLWFGRTGSFLRGYVPGEASYVTDRGLPPTQLGVIRIEMTPRREGNHLVIDIHGSV